MNGKIKYDLIAIILFSVLITACFIAVVYTRATNDKGFLRNPNYVLIRDFRNAKTANDFKEIKITDQKEIQVLWNALNYRFFFDMYEYGESPSDDDLSIWYPTPAGEFFVLDLNPNGNIGRMITMKSYRIYYMPEYAKTVRELYKKHKIHNEDNSTD